MTFFCKMILLYV